MSDSRQPQPPRPDPRDFLALTSALDEEERALRDTVRRWVKERILPEIATWFEAGGAPRAIMSELGELGLLGMHLEGHGCAGASATAYGLACMELEAGDSAIRSCISVQGSLSMFPIHRYGSEEQKRRYLPEMAKGALVGCFGLTEPESGSDPGSMHTRATRDGSSWVITGTKAWITNGTWADLAIVWAKTDEGVRGFIVDKDRPGFRARPIERKLSLRASPTAELFFDEVRVPDSARLPGVESLRGPLSCLNEARFGILFGAAGAARASYLAALDYAQSRRQFEKPIGAFQLTQRKLVEMMVRVEKASLLALHLGRAKDAGRLHPTQVSFGKMDNVREALWVAREARTILGANGITLYDAPLRHALNLESVLTYEGTQEIHQLVLGKALTGFDAFR